MMLQTMQSLIAGATRLRCQMALPLQQPAPRLQAAPLLLGQPRFHKHLLQQLLQQLPSSLTKQAFLSQSLPAKHLAKK